MLSAPARLFPSAFNTADADLPPHDPEQYTQCPRHNVRESRTRLARHSVVARQDFRGTRLPSRFYCNRKPPLSASAPHRFMKHPAPIFKTKAPAPPPRTVPLALAHPPFTHRPIASYPAPNTLSPLAQPSFSLRPVPFYLSPLHIPPSTPSRRHPPPFALRKLTFLNR